MRRGWVQSTRTFSRARTPSHRNTGTCRAAQEGKHKATWKKEFKLPWRKAGPL